MVAIQLGAECEARTMLVRRLGNSSHVVISIRASIIRCQIGGFSHVYQLSDLKCISFMRQGVKRRFISIEDPENQEFSLAIFISSDVNDHEMAGILTNIKFVGKPEALKLIAVGQSGKFATITDETGLARTVKRGDLVMRNFGTIRKIEKNRLLIQEMFMNDDGGYEIKNTTLHLER